jgi:hypothetical protein
MKLTKKQAIKVVVLLAVGFVVYKCDVPLNIKPGLNSIRILEELKETNRNIWIYKPVKDTFLLEDSFRTELYKFKDVFLYDSRYLLNIHLRFFAPWGIIDYSSPTKFVTITTDFMSLKDKENARRGISYTITNAQTTNNLLDYRYSWPTDDSIKNNSYIQGVITEPVPDTIYLTFWGRADFHMPYSSYKTLPDTIQYSEFYNRTGYEDQIKLAEVKFLLIDSIKNNNTPSGIKRKLIIPWITKI